MFYVQNWDAFFPQHCALDILNFQLKNAEKSLQSYDSSTSVKRDSYLLTEFNKVQSLVHLIEARLQLLNQNTSDPAAISFLVNGKVEHLPALKNELKVFNQFKGVVEKKIGLVNDQFDSLVNGVVDEEFKQVLHQIRQIKLEKSNLYGSQSDASVQKVLECYSQYFNESQFYEFELLKNSQSEQGERIAFQGAFETKAINLLADIRKDLRKGNHKLYYCVIENDLFQNNDGGKYSADQQHTFVIEKTKEDQFRLYQSYNSQYSLKSYMASQLAESPGGLKSYVEFYPFLKSLQQLESANRWSHEVNELYLQCFGIDHNIFLGQGSKQGFLAISYQSVELGKEGNEQPGSVENPPTLAQHIFQWIEHSSNKLGHTVKNIGLGGMYGVMISAVALSCLYIAKWAS